MTKSNIPSGIFDGLKEAQQYLNKRSLLTTFGTDDQKMQILNELAITVGSRLEKLQRGEND